MTWLTTTWAEARRAPVLALLWAAAAALVIYVFIGGGYLIAVLHFAAIYVVFVTGLNIFMGFAGQVSFGHNAFAAISGYTSAVLTATYGWEPLPAAALGILGALIAALIVGYPTLRLRGHYLAMATLAIGLIVYEVAVQWQSVTQGYMGISGIPPLGIGRFEVTSDRAILDFPHRRRGARRRGRGRHPSLAAWPRFRGHRWQRGCGARARHRCRALQARSPS